MTIDQLIDELQKLSAEGHGHEPAYTLGHFGYSTHPMPVSHVGGHWLYSERLGVWA